MIEPKIRVKKITFINQSLAIGGAETFNQGLLSWFSSQGSEIDAYVTNRKFCQMLKDSGLKTSLYVPVIDLIGDWKGFVKGILLMPLSLFTYFWLVWRARNSSLILLTGYIEKLIVTPLALLFRLPVVWIEFGPMEGVLTKFASLPGFLYRLAARLPATIVFPTKNTYQKNRTFVDLPSQKVKIIPCAISTPGLRKNASPAQVVCCVSRLEKGKGQDLLLQSWPRVLSAFPNAHLKIVGTGDFLPHLKAIAKNLGIVEKVSFTGWVDDSLSEMSSSQIVVFPSLWPLEGFGLVLLEAMSQKRPLVAFSTGPIPETVVHNRSGILVPPGDTARLSQAIIKLLSSSTLRRQMGDFGYSLFQQKYTFQTIGNLYQDLFNSLGIK